MKITQCPHPFLSSSTDGLLKNSSKMPDWGLSQRPVRVDCGLSYTTGQATIAQSAIVACESNN